MLRRIRIAWISVALAALGLPGMVRGQNMALPSNLGPIATPTGMMSGAAKQEADPGIAVKDTVVSFLDGAMPRNAVGLRFDGMYNNRQPMRAEYLFAKGGLPNSVGFPLPETRVDYQDFTSFAEYSFTPWFSVFVEGPYRWLNPEVNANTSGPSDMKYGMKLCTWSSDNIIATFLVRLYQPTARRETLGTGHWSIEPGVLAAWQVIPNVLIEGDVRYFVPLGNSDFAGDVFRYGVGVSYKHRFGNGVWAAPVVEGIGWTVVTGQTMIASSADSFIVKDAHGQTIINGYAGVRFGYWQNLDFYLGYGRPITGETWSREMYRFEMRYSY